VWPQLTLASVLVVAGHTVTFVIAARVAGCTAPLGELIALLMVVQTAVVIPLSIGGWGLREGAAAWAFAAAGLGAANGVTVAILYAVLMLVAVAPGAGLLLGDAVRRRRGRGHSGESRGPDPAPLTREAIRGLPALPGDRPWRAATETNAVYLTTKARRGGHDLLSRSLERAAEPYRPTGPAHLGTADR
jgi:hypothetical protein